MGDTSKHLSSFKVENFKRFESFEMKDLAQFNLIVGDNNVGKTSVLEALLLDVDRTTFLNNLFGALSFRKLKGNLTYQDIELFANKNISLNKNKYKIIFTTNFNSVSIDIDRQAQLFTFVGEQGLVFVDDFAFKFYDNFFFNTNLNFPFLPFYRGHDTDLTRFYSRLQQNRTMKQSFIESIRVMLPNVEGIELSSPYFGSDPHLIVYQNNVDYSLPLALFGDGALKLFRLLAEIIISKGNRLMIDEVDAGIHYSRFKEFWRVILKTAKDNDVQLFMTTHNQEFIKYFVEVLEALPDFQNETRIISLVENAADKSVKSYTYTYSQFEANINLGNEIRG